MDKFIKYLQVTKETVKNIHLYKDIHIVIGNESCDLDSTVSSIVLAYFLNQHKIPQIPNSSLVVPIINLPYENFLLRSENCFVLQKYNVPLDFFIYRDELNVAELLNACKVTTSLVDHHVLSKRDQVLESTVIQIFDHRPIDPSCKWSNTNVKLKIEEVGSCSTLIAEEIFKTDEDFLDKDLAYIIYETIIFDTVALLPENGRAKELDLTIAKKLEEKFSFTEGRKVVYERLWAAHNDVSHLTPKQILSKDLKIVENIPVPGLPMLVENFLKLKDAHNAMQNFAEDHNVTLLVLIGLDATNGVKRDLGIYWKHDSKGLRDNLLNKLNRSEDLKGYNFCFVETCSGYDDVTCLRQNNIKLSRKQIVPLIRDAVVENIK